MILFTHVLDIKPSRFVVRPPVIELLIEGLLIPFIGTYFGQGHAIDAVSIQILPGGVEGMMWVKTIEAEKPGLVCVLINELDGFFSAPGCLVVGSGNAFLDVRSGRTIVEILPAKPLRCQPLGIGVFGPVGLWMMRPMKDLVTIFDALFHFSVGAAR